MRARTHLHNVAQAWNLIEAEPGLRVTEAQLPREVGSCGEDLASRVYGKCVTDTARNRSNILMHE